MILSGETAAKQIGCVAGRQKSSWGINPRRSVFFYKIGGICDKGYHGLRSASRWFCKFYCSKAVIVGLIFNTRQETISVSHIVMFAEKTYNAFEPVGHIKRRKERES